MFGLSDLRVTLSSYMTRVEIEVDGQIVRAFDSFTVPLPGEYIHWETTYQVRVVSRAWVIDKDVIPQGRARCVLLCEKTIWPKKGK